MTRDELVKELAARFYDSDVDEYGIQTVEVFLNEAMTRTRKETLLEAADETSFDHVKKQWFITDKRLREMAEEEGKGER